MTRTLSLLGLGLALAATGAASAQSWGNESQGYTQDGYDYAEVLRVDPILSTYDRPSAREQCWSQPVTYREPPRYQRADRHDRAPAILGAIIGGAIGNQFGHGHGRDAATAAGALLGYQSVRDDQRRWDGYYSGGREYTRYEQRCATRTDYQRDYQRDAQVTGYDVTYNYRGQIGHTTTSYHPGDRIRVRVSVIPDP